MKTFALLILLFSALTGFAQKAETRKKSVTWKIDNLNKIGGKNVTVWGNPQIIKTDKGAVRSARFTNRALSPEEFIK